MPRPPDIDDFAKINFIANYAMLGCRPPLDLFVEFAAEPANEVVLLFLLPDLVDIGQAIFDPQVGRRRKPGRHGRKKRLGGGIPDTSDMIGQNVRAAVNPGNYLKIGPFNYIFRIWNVYERAAFTAAVIEGFTDVGYEGLLGVITHDPTFCPDFARLVRKQVGTLVVGGAGPIPDPWGLAEEEVKVGFASTPFSAGLNQEPCVAAFNCTLMNQNESMPIELEVGIWDNNNEPLALSPKRTLEPGEETSFQLWCHVPAGVNFTWGLGERVGFATALKADLLAFERAAVPWSF